jgi:drug/metabolite transporter (DMT)-like permease
VRRAYLYTGLVVASWGCSLPATKALLLAERNGRHLTPLEVAFWAIAVGWVALLLALAVLGQLPRLVTIAPRGWLVLAAMGFFGWAGYTTALNVAFTLIPLPDAVIINYLHPVFVVLFQGGTFAALVRPLSRWEDELPTAHRSMRRLAFGVALCLLGVALIATNGRLQELGQMPLSVGALAALFAAICWGVYSNLGRFVTLQPGTDPRGMGGLHGWASMTFGVGMLAAALLPQGGPSLPSGYDTRLYFGGLGPYETSAWVLLAFMGVIVYGGGYTLWLMAIDLGRRAGEAHKLPSLTYLTPVLAVILGWLTLHEPFGRAFWQGAAFIAAGNVIIALGRGAARTDPSAPPAARA